MSTIQCSNCKSVGCVVCNSDTLHPMISKVNGKVYILRGEDVKLHSAEFNEIVEPARFNVDYPGRIHEAYEAFKIKRMSE